MTMAQNYIFVRLNLRRLNKYEKQRVERIVENLQRKTDDKDRYVFISLLEWRKIEDRIVLRPDLYKNLEVDLVMRGGAVGSEEFMGWLEKLPRDDTFHNEGDIEIDGSVFWDSPDEG